MKYKKEETLKAFPLGKARKVEGTTFPTWLDANKLAPVKLKKKISISKEKNSVPYQNVENICKKSLH